MYVLPCGGKVTWLVAPNFPWHDSNLLSPICEFLCCHSTNPLATPQNLTGCPSCSPHIDVPSSSIMQENFSRHASDKEDGVDVNYNWTHSYLRRRQDQWVTWRWLIEYKWEAVGGLAKMVRWNEVKLIPYSVASILTWLILCQLMVGKRGVSSNRTFTYLLVINRTAHWFYFNWSHPDVFSLKYSKNKFSKNTTNLLSIEVATCFDS